MKEVNGKAQKMRSILRSKITVSIKEMNEEKGIGNELNNLVIDIDPKLAREIPEPARPFESYMSKSNTIMSSRSISVNELKDTFFSLKTNKCPGHGEINFSIITLHKK